MDEPVEMKNRDRVLFHVDMDSFFASIEIHDNPALRGKPIIVGGRPESRSVVCSPSYEARKFGIHAGMATAEARRLCPHGIFLPGNVKKYLWYSLLMQRTLIEFTDRVEPFSIDEAFMEFNLDWNQPEAIRRLGEEIRSAIRRRLGVPATIGIAPNKMLAKMASKAGKPDGLKILSPKETNAFLEFLPVGKLWGVGERTQASLHRLGMYLIKDVRRFSPDQLKEYFGVWGPTLHTMAWGIDETPLTPYHEREPIKSLGHEETFPEDLCDKGKILAHLMELSEKVAARLRKKKLYTRLVTVKRKLGDLSQQTRAQSLAWPTQLESDLFYSARRALGTFTEPERPIRLLGVTAGRLIRSEDLQETLLLQPLFETDCRLASLVDRARFKYGPAILHRARSTAVQDYYRLPLRKGERDSFAKIMRFM